MKSHQPKALNSSVCEIICKPFCTDNCDQISIRIVDIRLQGENAIQLKSD